MQQLLRRAVTATCFLTIFILFFNKPVFADVTLTTQTVAAANLQQNSTNNIVYIVKMDVTLTPVTISGVQYMLGGTFDNNDLTFTNIWFNATAPSLTGATGLTGGVATFAAPHAFSFPTFAVNPTIAAGASGYFIFTVNVAPAATTGNTVKLNGATNPVVFTYTSSPVVTNNQTDLGGLQTILAAAVTLSTVSVAPSSVLQGTSNVITYIMKMDVANAPVQMNNLQFTLGGTFDNNDLTTFNLYFNSAPNLTGASGLAGGGATVAAPHLFSASISQVFNTGTTYIIVVVNLSPTATAGNTIKLDGAANPVTVSFLTSPTITNNQTDLGGVQTITAATVSLSSIAVPAANVLQGTSNTVAYILKMDVAGFGVQLSNVQFTLGGTFDNNDLTGVNVYSNTSPSFPGASFIGSGSGAFAAPHVYNIPVNQVMNAGSTWYILVVFNLSGTATAGNTIKIDGAANPVVATFFTGPTITNNQTDVAGTQTIVAATVNLSSNTVAAANVLQGTSNVVAYILKMDVTGFGVQLSNVQFTLGGTYDNNDLTSVNVYSNTSPIFTGASFLGSASGAFAAPHVYNISASQVMNAGSTWYILVVVNLSGTATAGDTIKIDGAANPIVATFLTGPTITNNQTDVAGVQTIVAPAVTLSSSPVAASNVQQGATAVITSITKVDVTGFPVTVNSIQYTLGGTFDNNDLTNTAVYYNASTPSLTGAVLLNTASAGFAAPHAFNITFSQLIAAGATGYFITTVDIAAAGTTGNTIKLNAATNPVVLGYTTGPSVTNNQTDVFGTKTILAAGVTLSSPAVSSGNITQGSANNVLYVLKVDVTNLPVTVNAYQFVVGGTYDNDDLTTVGLWYNASAPSLSGATFLTSSSAGFAAPHTYNFGFGQLINAGATGYFIFTASLSPTATAGNTVLMDGAANPVVLTFATVPPVTNNQTNSAGVQTITGVLPLRLLSFTGNAYHQQSQLQWVTTDEINTKNFEVEWSVNGVDFSSVGVIPSAHNSSANKTYSFVHQTPGEGINYYRLKMVDLDGHYTYSATVKISLRFTVTLVTVYPNPVTDIAVLHIQADQNSTLQLKLLSADGSLLQTKTVTLNKGNNRLEWNMQQLPRGVYTIAATNQSIIPVHVVRN